MSVYGKGKGFITPRQRKVPVHGQASCSVESTAILYAASVDVNGSAVGGHTASDDKVRGQVCAFNVAVHGCDDERLTTRCAVAVLL